MTKTQTISLGILLASIAAALVVVPLADTRGRLGIGDGIVGAGTLLLAGATFWLASATFQIDRRAAKREADRLDHDEKLRKGEVRNAARLLDAELEVARTTIDKIVELRSWKVGAEVPRSAWDRFNVQLLAEVPPNQGLELVRFFSRLEVWARFVGNYLRQNPAQTAMGVGEARNDLGEVNELVELCAAAKSIVNRIAYRQQAT